MTDMQNARVAGFWEQQADGSLTCELCYRRCHLQDGERGWCGIRMNRAGEMHLEAHGVVSYAQQLTFSSHWAYKLDSPVLALGGVGCTSACSFCSATDIALNSERLPWFMPDNPDWHALRQARWGFNRALLTPEGVMDMAEHSLAYSRMGVQALYFGGNEPLLTWEWLFDIARLAKETEIDGGFLDVMCDTNGYAHPEAIKAVAPYVDYAFVSFKGSGNPGYYANHMKSVGALPHVYEAVRTRRDAPDTMLALTDVIAPPHWVNQAQAEDDMRRLYSWIADACGPMTPVEIRRTIRPQRPKDYNRAPYVQLAPNGQEHEVWEREGRALEIAREAGLEYAYPIGSDSVTCHHCAEPLLQIVTKTNRITGKEGHRVYSHVTDHTCQHCGGWVPIT